MRAADGTAGTLTAKERDAISAAKSTLRGEIAARRAARTTAERTATAAGLAQSLAQYLAGATAAPFLAGPAPATQAVEALLSGAAPAHLLSAPPQVVAVYLSVGHEPDTGPLRELLHDAGIAMIAPVLRGDGDLDWAALRPGDPLTQGLRHTVQPGGPILPSGAIEGADLVLVPALAVDRRGRRLGRGGGSYDRVLSRARDHQRLLAVVHDDEVVEQVPTEEHDRRVDGALTPTGVVWFELP